MACQIPEDPTMLFFVDTGWRSEESRLFCRLTGKSQFSSIKVRDYQKQKRLACALEETVIWNDCSMHEETTPKTTPKPSLLRDSKKIVGFLIASASKTVFLRLWESLLDLHSQITHRESNLHRIKTTNNQSKWLMTKISLPLSLTTVPECAKVRLVIRKGKMIYRCMSWQLLRS